MYIIDKGTEEHKAAVPPEVSPDLASLTTKSSTTHTAIESDKEIPSPKLPIEVLRLIISHFAEDKDTLVQCIRVSSDVNAITAPFLYRSIILGPSGIMDLNETKNIDNRLSKPRRHYFQYTREVEVLPHFGGECPPLDDDQIGPLKVDILKISFDPRVQDSSDHCCYILWQVSPRKLILGGSSITYPGPDSVSCKTIKHMTVIITDPRPVSENGIDLYIGRQHTDTRTGYALPPKCKKAIYVLWTARPRERFYDVSSFDNRKRRRPDRDTTGRLSLWEEFHFRLAMSSGTDLMPSNLIIVNLRAMSLCHPDLSPNALVRKSRTSYEQELARILSVDLNHPDWTPEERKQVTVKYITMEEYLNDYDWKGEFTEEQVAPWLESMKARQSRKRSQKQKA